jgi:hypothetical protein
MSPRATLTALVLAVALAPHPLSAQEAAAPVRGAAQATLAVATIPVVVGLVPPWSGASPDRVFDGAPGAAARERAAPRSLAPMFPPRHRKPGVALMIVGGAGILVGTVISSDLVTVGSAGVGLYGLYLYLR